jgi:pimeloyl-ACP methyl ester carboxylesterase
VPLYPAGTWHEEMPRDAGAAAARELDILLRHPASVVPPPPPACAPLPGRVTTDYVDIGGTSLLVRSAATSGLAPLLVLPHLPGSSWSCEELLRAVGEVRPACAIDVPGHGESDTLPGTAQSVDVWADSMLRAIDALGLGRLHLYGHNGGAALAVELATRAPGRVLSVVLDAPIVLDGEKRSRFANDYAPDIVPTWDGSHLLRAWHHMRDQELWWPWFDRHRAAIRGNAARIDPASLTLRVREILKQPHSYRPAWQAVLSYPMAERLAMLSMPLSLIGATEDVFAPLLPAARTLLPDVPFRAVADSPAARAAALRELLGSP